jgi:hypothetical protein
MQYLINNEIPEMRKEAGIQRLAGPEINVLSKILGDATLPSSIVNRALANVDTAADYLIARRNLANQALSQDPSVGMTMDKFRSGDQDLLNGYYQTLQDNLKKYPTIGVPTTFNSPQSTAVAPPGMTSAESGFDPNTNVNPTPDTNAPPSTNAPPLTNAPGGNTPPSSPAPPPVQIYRADPSNPGHFVVVTPGGQ